jgi:bacillithiol biosynthesis cysteine-adding enzyme BshC
LTLRIDVRPLRGGPLVEDHLRGEPRAAAFYEGRPTDPEAYRAKLEEVRARFGRAERERAAAALRPTSPSAAERLRRFVEEGGAMVTTGQQPALFGGPLYTVHKILTAVRLAEALEASLGCVVLPVFWSGSEDHDFAEANHAHVADGAGKVHRLAVLPTDARPVPMSDMALGADVDAVSGEFADLVSSQPEAWYSVRRFLAEYPSGRTIGDAFVAHVMELFRSFDLLVTDAADPALKEASLPVLLGEAERAAEHDRLVAERTAEIVAAGYEAQVAIVPDAANLFFHGPAGRERLVRDGEGWAGSGERFSDDGLREAIRAEPGRFSPNVLLRPVVESAVFPTLAYVAGPGEMAYFAQIGPLFRSFGIRPPVVFPRFSATIVPAEVDAALARLGLEADDLRPPAHEVAQRVAHDRLPAEVEERLRALRAAVYDGYVALMDAARAVDPNLDGALAASRNRALLEAAEAERKVLAHVKRQDGGVMRLVELARGHLFPGGVPQERVLNVLQYLAREPRLLEELAARMTVAFPVPAAV